MSRDKQIEEIYEVLTRDCDTSCIECKFDRLDLCVPHHKAEALYNAGYRKQSEGEWKKMYDKAPRYVCTACNHLYNNKEYKYCPHCGAKMKGGAE